jgi:endonuclease-3
LQRIHRERGELSLDFLCSLPTPEAVEYLRSFPGVGPKTAACVLLFACRRPVLPVDTHVHRVSQRLGLIGPGTDAAKAHDALARFVPARQVLEFHIQLIRHGRGVCAARNPQCEDCPLVDLCPEGRRRL